MNGRAGFLALLALVLLGPAPAQGTQVAEDEEVGVRLTVPKGWEWRKRDSNPQPSLFVNCMPEVTRNYPCYLLVEARKAAPNQTAITDGDRSKWESWVSADGMRAIVSKRDLKVAGYPAFEFVFREGQQPNAERGRRTFVLMSRAGRVIDLSYRASLNGKDLYAHYLPAMDTILESLAPFAAPAGKPPAKK